MIIFEFFYLLGIKFYGAGIFVYALINQKAAHWIKGRKHHFITIRKSLKEGEKRIWFHCPSLGEFEQGRPVLNALKKEYPGHKIVLTFFSPSGYEIRKKDPQADYLFYMPLDGPWNSARFIDLIKPEMAFFVKYDFWHFYIKALKKRGIPCYYISSIFRPSQVYFKWYGVFFDKILRRVTHFFVQNQASLELLYKNSIPSVTVSGDTRFDRVVENSLNRKEIPEIIAFKGSAKLLVAGSTWPSDEERILPVVCEEKPGLKWILVPHEINDHHINKLEKQLGDKAIRFSRIREQGHPENYRVIIFDNVGLLSSLYAYSDIAYVGGGFGSGIHNILEAVVFGVPVIIGPRYEKFQEARDLVGRMAVFPVSSREQFSTKVAQFLQDEAGLQKIREVCAVYIQEKKGATSIIMDYLRMNHSMA